MTAGSTNIFNEATTTLDGALPPNDATTPPPGGAKTVWESFFNVTRIGEFRVLAVSDDTIVIRVENETGEGDMVMHNVFNGIYLMYNDFHMDHYTSMYQTLETVLAVDFCREGSLIMECENGFYQVKKAGSVCIDSRVHHMGTARFPTGHFHGITIGFENKLAEQSLQGGVPGIPVDLAAIRDKFCGSEGFFIIQQEDTLRRLFMDLYHVPERARLPYFRSKVMELLVCLQAMEPGDVVQERPYFYHTQVEKVHAAAKLMTDDLGQTHTVAELAQRFGMSQTAFKNCFKGIYGKPVFTWLTERRMREAAKMLVEKPEMSVAEVAYTVGYENAGKFASAFKRHNGVTPREYRSGSF